jgi:glycolate oxidase iron-sulfur subunit
MQTNFATAQLTDSDTRESEKILRSCVHCGFCTATCPTYLLLGDELDSPRGRIYLIKEMLEGGKAATPEIVRHIDRCLSCLSCMTTCPSGVHYMHLVDHARSHIETTYRRPLAQALVRRLLALVIPYPKVFRLALLAARIMHFCTGLARKIPQIGPSLAAMLDLAPDRLPARSAWAGPGEFAPIGKASAQRVALLSGCAQAVLDPAINEATIRLLNRLGVSVVLPAGEGCCGALTHHMGRAADALNFARRNIDVWDRELSAGRIDAIVITASGCGTTIKDYGFMLREDPQYAAKAKRVAAKSMDISEYLCTLSPVGPLGRREPLPAALIATGLVVAYHSACSMQHGQKLVEEPKQLLRAAGFTVKDVAEGHICCGSAGTYNILQPEIAAQLQRRKIANIIRTKPDVIATGNIGCITQISGGLKAADIDLPLVHTAQLLDWAYGGPLPVSLQRRPKKIHPTVNATQ